MNAQITPRDLELLSAYLDGQLNEKERARVDARLQKDEAYRNELETLNHTRLLLRSLSPRRAPRNFTLSAQTAEQLKPTRAVIHWVPALRVTAALASFLLIVTFAGELLFGRPVSTMPAAMEAPAAAESQAFAADSSQNPPIIEWGEGGATSESQKAYGMGGIGGGSGESDSVSVPTPAGPQVNIQIATPETQPSTGAVLAPEPTYLPPTGFMQPTATPVGEPLLGAASVEAATPTTEVQPVEPLPTPTPEPTIAAESQPLENSGSLIVGVPSTDQRGEIIATPEVLAVTEPAETTAPVQPLRQLHIAQLVLAVFVVGSGLVLILLRKRG
ncbi:MAG: hypothetical protein ABFD44_03450 [Anaerolineaceae bacterium]